MKPISFAVALFGLTLAVKPAIAGETEEQVARASFAEGNKLVGAGDFEGALQRFQYAYERLPSVKILLNIATMLKELGRNAEAANAYQRYLSSPTADPNKKANVEQALEALDQKVAKLRIEVDDSQMRVRLDGRLEGGPEQWLAVRVEPGTHTVLAEKDGAPPVTLLVTVSAGEARTVRLEKPAAQVAPPPSPVTAIPVRVQPASPRGPLKSVPPSLSHAGQIGLFARADIEGQGRGAIGAFGLTYGIGNHVEVRAAALMGRDKGVEPGATVFIFSGNWKPRISLGVPIFVDDGARVGVHPGVGIEWDPLPAFGLFAELGAAFFPRTSPGYEHVVFVPVIGAQARF